MSTDVTPSEPPKFKNLAEVMDRVGHVPLERVCADPPPGAATEDDLLRLNAKGERLYELVDGILVEKTMGYSEGMLAAWLIYLIRDFLQKEKLGIIAGADGTVKLMEALVRVPDVSFVSWDSLPDRKVPTKPIPDLVPDLAIEVLSKSNTKSEMAIKLKEYFMTGTKLVWYVDPKPRTVTVYTAPDQSTELGGDQELDGGDVLPGFRVKVSEIFAELDQQG